MKVRNGILAGFCPTQFEGELQDGRALYIRFRHGRLFWGVGENDSRAFDNAMKKYKDYEGDGGDGILTFDSIKRLIPELDWSEADVEDQNSEI